MLADLGIAAEVCRTAALLRRETTGGQGHLVYQSPETLNMSDAGAPRDWWALGHDNLRGADRPAPVQRQPQPRCAMKI